MTYQQWLADAAQALNQVNPTENGKVDALVLLQHATGKSRTQILAFDETEIDEKVRLKLTALLDRRLKGEPIAYILGEKEFWSFSDDRDPRRRGNHREENPGYVPYVHELRH